VSASLVVFVDAHRVEVTLGSTVLDAVRAFDAAAAAAVAGGSRAVTDSRGLPIAAETPVHGGTILRLVSARRREGDSANAQ
jgi:hypothetical protein